MKRIVGKVAVVGCAGALALTLAGCGSPEKPEGGSDQPTTAQEQPKQEEKKPEIKEITLPEKMTIRELAEAMKMQPSVIVTKLFMEGTMVTVNHEIDFEKAQEMP